MPSPTDALSWVEVTLADAQAELTTDLGGHQEVTSARVWQGQVLVDWEPDATAGGSLLRLELLRRLVALHAQVEDAGAELRIVAPGRIVAGLSAEHADLVKRLGGARRLELRTTLRFAETTYVGGHEVYYLIEHGQRAPLLQISAAIRPRLTPDAASPHTSPARS